jgi:Metallopeptidase family M24
MLEGLDACFKALVPGTVAGDVDKIARDRMDEARQIVIDEGVAKGKKVGGEMGCKCGYSIGASPAPDWADEPTFFLSPDNHQQLRKNMVFHVIGAFLQTPWGAIALSETVAVDDGTGRVLTGRNSARKIVVVKVPKDGAAPAASAKGAKKKDSAQKKSSSSSKSDKKKSKSSHSSRSKSSRSSRASKKEKK